MYKDCESLLCGSKQDWIDLAPCPPPMMEHSHFFEHVLKQNLSKEDACKIGRRCQVNGSFTDERCSPLTTTTTTTTSDSYLTGGTTSLTLKTSNECNSLCLIMILSVTFCVIIIGIIMIFVKRQKKNDSNGRKEFVASYNEGFDNNDDTLDDTNNVSQGGKGNDEELQASNKIYSITPVTIHTVAMENNSDQLNKNETLILRSDNDVTDNVKEENGISITHL